MNRLRKIFALSLLSISLIYISACQSHPSKVRNISAKEPTLKEALAAPAADLAQGYLWVKFLTEKIIPAAEEGATFHLPGKLINKSNVQEYRKKYEKRLSIYNEAIGMRGYKNVSGRYRGSTTESCQRIKSLWVGVIHEGSLSGIEISQDGFEAQILIRIEHEGRKMSLKNPAAIVESAISVVDASNSDYYFKGVITEEQIVIRPKVSVLDTWPQWAGPPSRDDLENCTITLQPQYVDSAE